MAQTQQTSDVSPTASPADIAKDAVSIPSPPINPLAKDHSASPAHQSVVVVIPDHESQSNAKKKTGFPEVTSSIAEFLHAIAWPLVILVIVLVFRKGIGNLISRLKKGKFAGSEWEFETLIEDAERNAAAIAPPAQPEIDPVALALAETEPRGAVIAAWLQIERLIDELLESKGVPRVYPNRRGPLTSVREIEKAHILPSEYMALLHDLRVLRNDAAHSQDFDPSPESVVRYLQLSARIMKALRNAKNNLPAGAEQGASP